MNLSCPQRLASFPSLVSPILYWGLLESPSNFHVSEAQTMSWAQLSEHSAKHTFTSPSLCTALPWILNGLPENMGTPQTETWWESSGVSSCLCQHLFPNFWQQTGTLGCHQGTCVPAPPPPVHTGLRLQKAGEAAHICNFVIWRWRQKSMCQGHPWLHTGFGASLGYWRYCL